MKNKILEIFDYLKKDKMKLDFAEQFLIRFHEENQEKMLIKFIRWIRKTDFKIDEYSCEDVVDEFLKQK